MKRCAILCMLMLTVCLLCACQRSTPGIASLSPAKFGKEAQMLLDVLGDNVAFFDYSAGKDARSFTIGVWFCEDGEWTSRGELVGEINESGKGRFGVRATPTNCELFLFEDDGHTRYAINEGVDFSAVTSSGMMQLNAVNVPVFDEENVLLVKRGSNSPEFRTFDLQDFRSMDAELGIAFTITFHQ